VAGLSGTGRLADDLYLVAHHEQTGKPHLQPRALGLGLAGTLLAELMLSRSIRLWRGVITAADGILPGDDLARSVLGQVASERAFAPLIRVKSALGPSGPVAAQNAALGGLAAACGLGHQLALYLPPNAHRRLEEAAGQLDPGLRELIAQTRAAVDSALLAHRV
jgi:hypothetical protein